MQLENDYEFELLENGCENFLFHKLTLREIKKKKKGFLNSFAHSGSPEQSQQKHSYLSFCIN